MLRDGVVDAVEGDPEREAAFWFLTCGVSLVSLGWSFRRARRQTGTLPSFVGPALLGIATAGVTFMPRSGFWAVFVAASWPTARDINREVEKWAESTTA